MMSGRPQAVVIAEEKKKKKSFTQSVKTAIIVGNMNPRLTAYIAGSELFCVCFLAYPTISVRCVIGFNTSASSIIGVITAVFYLTG